MQMSKVEIPAAKKVCKHTKTGDEKWNAGRHKCNQDQETLQ